MGVCRQRATCYSMWVLISLPEERRDTSGITTERDSYTVCVERKKGRRVTSKVIEKREGGRGIGLKNTSIYLSYPVTETEKKLIYQS